MSLIGAQLRRLGMVITLAPVLAGVVFGVTGAGLAATWPAAQAMVLTSWLAQIFIICVGVTIAAAVTGDPLIEVHESTPIGFRRVQVTRAIAVTISGVVGGIILFVLMQVAGVWPHDAGWISVVSPTGAVVFIAAIALATAAFAGTTSATTIAVVAAWMFLALLWDPYVLVLGVQRGVPLIVAIAFTIAAWKRLGDGERNIAKVATI